MFELAYVNILKKKQQTNPNLVDNQTQSHKSSEKT